MTLTLLGIETSCDETAAAIVRAEGPGGPGRILADIVLSQIADHAPYGGVVPEIAARAHLDHLDALVVRAFDQAGLGWGQIDGIAATTGPGLIGGLIVGASFAKAAAFARGLPFVAVNHLEAHALTARLTDGTPFPYLLLLVSGGHCQLVAVDGVGRYRRLGTTLDDAVGEAFDKTAKLLDLGWPGGPRVEAAAQGGQARRFTLPRPMKGRDGCDFSFSGLKTAVRLEVERLGDALDEQARADLAAAFQLAVADILEDRTGRAMTLMAAELPAGAPRRLVVAGGVAANQALRQRLGALAAARGFELAVPPGRLCTDNAAMVAWAGLERYRLGQRDGLDARPRARWPLAEILVPA